LDWIYESVRSRINRHRKLRGSKMRLKILLEPSKEPTLIPWDYRTSLTRLVYEILSLSDAEYGRWLHDKGFIRGKRVYRLFVYSDLQLWHRVPEKDGLLSSGNLTWQLASPDRRFIEKFMNGIRRKDQRLDLFESSFNVVDMLTMEAPSFPDAVTLSTISPVVASTYDPKMPPHPTYLSPDQPEFALALEKNLFAKWEAFHETPWDKEGFGLRVWSPRGKLIRVFNINVRAWYLKVQLWGSSELIRFAYETGLGEKNSMGFGMLEAGG